MMLSRNFGWFLSLIAPLVIAWTLVTAGDSSVSWLHACTFVLVVGCGACDQISGKIPNFVTYSGIVWGLAINGAPWLSSWIVTGGNGSRLFVGDVGLACSVAGLVLCFGIMLIGFVIAGSGADCFAMSDGELYYSRGRHTCLGYLDQGSQGRVPRGTWRIRTIYSRVASASRRGRTASS
jgi:hypothetical protein